MYFGENSKGFNSHNNIKKNKPPFAHRVFGALFVIFGVLLGLSAVLGMKYKYENSLWVLLAFGIIIGFFGVLFFTGALKKLELARRTKGVFLTKEQIDKLEHETELASIDGMEGHEFEYYCADLLKKNGFSAVSVTKGSGDQGVDVLATKDGIKYAVQCKNNVSPLGNSPVQEVNAGKTFYHCHVGVVMTNSTFTTSAKTLAQATGVLLWDRTVLQGMMRNLQND